MKRFGWMAAAAVLAMAAGPVLVRGAEAVVGQPAPEIDLTNPATEKRLKLSDHRGSYVVLEWFNPQCPFVKKHYLSGNMQALQREYMGKGVVWWTVNSSAPGREGHTTPDQSNAILKEWNASPSIVLLDEDGAVGKRYGAKTTPHLFIINPDGVLIYAGAIDSKRSPDPADIDGAVNYVRQTLDQAMSGRPIDVAQTDSYGCSVKY